MGFRSRATCPLLRPSGCSRPQTTQVEYPRFTGVPSIRRVSIDRSASATTLRHGWDLLQPDDSRPEGYPSRPLFPPPRRRPRRPDPGPRSDLSLLTEVGKVPRQGPRTRFLSVPPPSFEHEGKSGVLPEQTVPPPQGTLVKEVHRGPKIAVPRRFGGAGPCRRSTGPSSTLSSWERERSP